MKAKKRMNPGRGLALIALSLVIFIQTFAFKAYSGDTAQSRSDLSFVARPYQKSKNYVIYEIGFKTQVSGPQNRSGDAVRMLTVDLGMMHNLNEKTAVGVSLYGSTGDRAATLGIRPRIRRWLDESRGVDFSAGLLYAGGDGSGSYSSGYKWPGFITSVSFDLVRSLSVDLTLETLRYKYPTGFDQYGSYVSNGSKSATALYLGVNGKDYVAAVGTGVMAALVVIVLATWNSGSGW